MAKDKKVNISVTWWSPFRPDSQPCPKNIRTGHFCLIYNVALITAVKKFHGTVSKTKKKLFTTNQTNILLRQKKSFHLKKGRGGGDSLIGRKEPKNFSLMSFEQYPIFFLLSAKEFCQGSLTEREGSVQLTSLY
jgi:hypothetical protein